MNLNFLEGLPGPQEVDLQRPNPCVFDAGELHETPIRFDRSDGFGAALLIKRDV